MNGEWLRLLMTGALNADHRTPTGHPSSDWFRLHVVLEDSRFLGLAFSALWYVIVVGTLLLLLVCRCCIVARTGHAWWLGMVWCLPVFVAIPALRGMSQEATIVLLAASILIAGTFQLWLSMARWPVERKQRDHKTIRRRRRRRAATRERLRA